jgi:hypothetical protein
MMTSPLALANQRVKLEIYQSFFMKRIPLHLGFGRKFFDNRPGSVGASII